MPGGGSKPSGGTLPEFDLRNFNWAGTGSANDMPSLAAAVAAVKATGSGRVVLPGDCHLLTGQQDWNGATTGSTIEIDGQGYWCHVNIPNGSWGLFQLSNWDHVILKNINFYGVPGAGTPLSLITSSSNKMSEVVNCRFISLHPSSDLLRLRIGKHVVRHCDFGASGSNSAVIHAYDQAGLTVRDSTFWDYGSGPTGASAAAATNSPTWIKYRGNAGSTGIEPNGLEVVGNYFDEGVDVSVWADIQAGGSPRYQYCHMARNFSNCRPTQAGGPGIGGAYYLRGAEEILIEDCWGGWNSLAMRFADLDNCRRAILRNCRAVLGPWSILTGSTCEGIDLENIQGIGTITLDAATRLLGRDPSGIKTPPRLTTAQRDALANKIGGEVIFNTNTLKGEMWDGSAWQPLWT